MAPSGQSTTIAHPSPTWEEQLAFIRGTTFCVPHPDRGQKAQQKQRCSSSKPVNTVQVGQDRAGAQDGREGRRMDRRLGAPWSGPKLCATSYDLRLISSGWLAWATSGS